MEIQAQDVFVGLLQNHHQRESIVVFSSLRFGFVGEEHHFSIPEYLRRANLSCQHHSVDCGWRGIHAFEHRFDVLHEIHELFGRLDVLEAVFGFDAAYDVEKGSYVHGFT